MSENKEEQITVFLKKKNDDDEKGQFIQTALINPLDGHAPSLPTDHPASAYPAWYIIILHIVLSEVLI